MLQVRVHVWTQSTLIRTAGAYSICSVRAHTACANLQDFVVTPPVPTQSLGIYSSSPLPYG